jgi:peptidoglycan/LPS O-acetylase OafA/YrhL
MSESEELTIVDKTEVDMEMEVDHRKPYFFQLDVLKALAIALVVMDHSLTWEVKGAIGSTFWERQAIPIFLIVMGFNMAYSFKYSGATTLGELYSWEYFKSRIVRYVFPFAILYMGSILVGLYTGTLNFDEYTLLGVLPFWGPGNWFIALLFGSIIVFPFVYWLFERQPTLTLILCFLAEIVMQGIMYIWLLYPIDSALEGFLTSAIRINVIFFLPAVGLGLWFSKGYNLFSMRNWFVIPYYIFSFVFMIDYTTDILSSIPNVFGEGITLIQIFFRGDYTLLFYGYAAMIFIGAMTLIPQTPSGKMQRVIQRIGRASYHIFLFQIFYMSILYYSVSIDAVISHNIPNFALLLGWPSELFYIPFYLINVAICIGGGLLWHEAEKRASAKRKSWYQRI